MLPISLNPRMVTVGLAGEGDAHARRLAMLRACGVEPVAVSADATEFDKFSLLYIAGLNPVTAEELASRVRAARVLVNVEDRPEHCDFHVPAMVRRGELTLTVSTNGRSPGLASRLRAWLEVRFGDSWGARLDELGAARTRWRSGGVAPGEIAERTHRIVDQEGWLS